MSDLNYAVRKQHYEALVNEAQQRRLAREARTGAEFVPGISTLAKLRASLAWVITWIVALF